MDADSLYHVSIQPKLIPQSQPQLYIYGYNAGGRPDGVWFANGDTWLKFNNRVRRKLEYRHSIRVDSDRLFILSTESDMRRLYETYGGYWINYEYFNLDFQDATSGHRYVYTGNSRLLWSNLKRKPGQSMRDILLQNNVIFDNAESARLCEFFRHVAGDDIERFKFPDWGRVSSDYAGMYADFDQHSANMRYFWYQSLNASSGCVWDGGALSEA